MQAVPIIAHGGEYVLSADVVDRNKAGRPSRGANVAGGSDYEAQKLAANGGVMGINVTVNGWVGNDQDIAGRIAAIFARAGGPQIPARAIAN